jgi:hypothetical protein
LIPMEIMEEEVGEKSGIHKKVEIKQPIKPWH